MLALAFVAAVGLAGIPGLVWTPLVILYLPALGGLCYWVVTAFQPTATGWLVRAGRLDAVRVETRTGDQVGILGGVPGIR